MNNSKLTLGFLLPLLIGALAVVASAQQPSQPNSSPNLSPALTSAQALIAELETPITCPDGTALCVAEVALARLQSASVSLRSLVRIYQEEEGIIQTQEHHLVVKDRIIADYEKLDKNNQQLDTNSRRIDTLGQDTARIYEKQHDDDKHTIKDLNDDLNSCRSSQKFVFLGGALTGGMIAWKVKSNSSSGHWNPFQYTQSGTSPAQRDYVNFSLIPQTNAEENLRRIVKTLNVPQ